MFSLFNVQIVFSGQADAMFAVTALDTGTGISLQEGNVIPFDDVKYDPGQNFDNVTHTYTAPAHGHYLLTLTLHTSSTSSPPGEVYI